MEIKTLTIKIGDSIKHSLGCPNCYAHILIDQDTKTYIQCHKCGEELILADKIVRNGRTFLVVKIKDI